MSRIARGRRRAVVVMTTLLVAALAAAGCGAPIGEGGRFGVVYMDAQGYYAGVRKGMQDEAAEMGRNVQLLELNAQGDASQESSFVDTVSSADVDALVLSPVSETASIPAIRLAHRSGVPVICYNTCIADEAARQYVEAFILGDPLEFGRLLGDAAAEYFIAEGIEAPQIGIVNCEQVEVCVQRRLGFEEALFAKVPDAEIVANQQGSTIDEAVDVAERILTAHPDLDAFFGQAGGATLGSIRAVQARNKVGQTVVFGGDMSTEAANALVDHRVLKGNVDISGVTVGRMAAETAQAVLAGNPPEEFILPAPVEIYTTPEDGATWLQEHPDGLP
ncbi:MULTISPECIES: substrate-binding domain-containing protein [Actinoalloteichus]|uniref:Monosaccharide ABC transporter substrate-binding protein, CUT2 family n=1 Tax=Actinoalloteichus fjordicus TaxID=1612552 RepID=A0AAC9PS73_9PSEU|nr:MULTISPECIES: substrate-binding domain-containing protein [Actinoalloteichus]APU14720.1 monosaccharide ABC transporter substrate-binding protein, CUT2 family [Actinoalloteichus fjordicus]APU20688.1 monosaccharide ABC transporter substrate-binding protein, CUT2 family [Actinoalloteichus sp. GBA129-24]